MSFAESTGLTSSVKDHEAEMTYNFGVYKHSKDRSRTERYILQFDFNEQALSTIQKGKFDRKIPFEEIRDYDSEVSPLNRVCPSKMNRYITVYSQPYDFRYTSVLFVYIMIQLFFPYLQDDLRFFIYYDDGDVEYDADSAEEKIKVKL